MRLLSSSPQLRLSWADVTLLLEAPGQALSSNPCFLQSIIAHTPEGVLENLSQVVLLTCSVPQECSSVFLHVFCSLLYLHSPCDPQRLTTALPSPCTLAPASLSLPASEAPD